MAFRADQARAYEGLFTQGSGYLHARGSLEEHFPDAPQNNDWLRMPGNVTAEKFPVTHAKWGTYLPGIFGRHPTLDKQMVNLPFFWLCTPGIDGERLNLLACQINDYQRALDLADGSLCRTFQWTVASGARVLVRFERFISMAKPHLAAQRMTLTPDRDVKLSLLTGIDSDIRTSGYDHLTEREMIATPDGVACRVTTDSNETVRFRTAIADFSNREWTARLTERQALLEHNTTIKAHTTFSLIRYTVATSSRDLSPIDEKHALDQALACGYNTLAAENRAAWSARWQTCDVQVEGDDHAQQALRCSLYHLLRCHVPEDARISIDAKGYAGDAYFGRFFWDTEMYMLPFYLYTDPDRARTFVDFRVQSLPGARANAAALGYPGARFAWESDPEGYERCPSWQYRDHEIHVTGDVVYAFTHFDRACPHTPFLHGPAAEVIVETARYWAARIDWRDGEDTPSLLGVMGPNEYCPICNNNAYTNRMAAFALSLAAGNIGKTGGATPAEQKAFARLAETLPIPRSTDGTLVLENENYQNLADPHFDTLWKDRAKGYAHNVPQEHIYRSKALKQADVLMLMMLFPQEFTIQDLQAAWDYYLPFTTHDSSLSPGAHAIVASRLGKQQDAWLFWQKTINYDLDTAHGGAAEGIHIANAAASWMVAILGFAGMATVMESEILILRPALPASWQRLAFPIVWKGAALHIEITQDAVTINNKSEKNLDFLLQDRRHTLPPRQAGSFPINP